MEPARERMTDEAAISAAVDVLGDRWSLLILRDVIFSDRRYFRALLTGSPEGIASNILADRLVKLVEAGVLTRGTAARGQRARYSLSEAGIQAVPIIVSLLAWGLAWRTADPPPGSSTGMDIDALMRDLRDRHLDDPATPAQE